MALAHAAVEAGTPLAHTARLVHHEPEVSKCVTATGELQASLGGKIAAEAAAREEALAAITFLREV